MQKQKKYEAWLKHKAEETIVVAIFAEKSGSG